MAVSDVPTNIYAGAHKQAVIAKSVSIFGSLISFSFFRSYVFLGFFFLGFLSLFFLLLVFSFFLPPLLLSIFLLPHPLPFLTLTRVDPVQLAGSGNPRMTSSLE